MRKCKDGYRSNEWCLLCKGLLCCQYNACAYSPKDFPVLTYNALEKRISAGKISITHIFGTDTELGAFEKVKEGDQEYLRLSEQKLLQGEGRLYLRARNVGEPIVDLLRWDPNPRTCINWDSKHGCKLTFEERPTEGRLLEPRMFFQCISHTTPQELAEEWCNAGMQPILYQLAREFGETEALPIGGKK